MTTPSEYAAAFRKASHDLYEAHEYPASEQMDRIASVFESMAEKEKRDGN